MPKKVDLYKDFASEYVTPRIPVLLRVKPAKYLGIAGSGEPASELFTRSIGALYNVAFTIKMARKFAGRDYAVAKLEGLWWGTPDDMQWTLMIRTPAFISATDLKRAQKMLLDKGKDTRVEDVKLLALKEGQCVQMLHVGPYTDEQRSIDAMRNHAAGKGLKFSGKHHEIYLSDPRRVPAERLRTILRNPVTGAAK